MSTTNTAETTTIEITIAGETRTVTFDISGGTNRCAHGIDAYAGVRFPTGNKVHLGQLLAWYRNGEWQYRGQVSHVGHGNRQAMVVGWWDQIPAELKPKR